MLAVVRTAAVVVLTAVHNLHLDSFHKFTVRSDRVLMKRLKYLEIAKYKVSMQCDHIILRWFKLTVALFSIRSKLIGCVTNTGERAQSVVTAMSAVALFYLTLINICDKNVSKNTE